MAHSTPESSEKREESYWVRLNKQYKGPFPPSEIAVLPQVGPYTLLCPGKLDPRRQRNWKFAKTFPAVRPLLAESKLGTLHRAVRNFEAQPEVFGHEAAADAPRAVHVSEISKRSRDSGAQMLVFVALLAASAGAIFWRSAPPEIKPAPGPAPRSKQDWLKTVQGVYMPACRKSVGEMAGERLPLIGDAGPGIYTVEWPGTLGPDSIKFQFDAGRELLSPMNQATWKAMDYRNKCT